MKLFKKTLFVIIILFSVFLIYKNWFKGHEIIGGDWPYISPYELKETTLIPPSWNSILNNGFGGISPLYSLQAFQQFTIFLSNSLHVPWVFIYKITWFGFFILLSVFSVIYFMKKVFPEISFLGIFIGVIIFSSNTYILMVTSGGQMGVALSYAITPSVIAFFIKLIDELNFNTNFFSLKNRNLSYSLRAGLILAIQVLFDPRLAYISIITVFLYFLFSLKKDLRIISFAGIFSFIIPFAEVVLLHFFWILPILVFHYNPASTLGSVYTGVNAFMFFSFADFSHSFSLLHPNWWENIFGKTYFLYPQFLILPLVAYLNLFFIKKKNSKKILFFLLMGLIGVFLSKGANDPFGFINSWLFIHAPGFILFRDPTKFYLMTALSYCILIPYSLSSLSHFLLEQKIKYKYFCFLPFLLFIIFWIYLIEPVFKEEVNGTFANYKIPNEYFKLGSFLDNDHVFYRTLWIPRQQRFSYYTNNHPSVEAEPLFNATSSAEVIASLKSKDAESYLQNLSVKYIIVPYDILGEIFVKDRKYDPYEYKKTISDLRKIPYLYEVKGFGRIIVFKMQNTKSHFRFIKEGKVNAAMVQPDKYNVAVSLKKPETLFFIENYNPYWAANINGKNIFSQKTIDGFNSFYLPKTGNYSFKISFTEKKYFTIGWMITGVTLIAILIFLLCNWLN